MTATDQELMRRVQAGDESCFTTIVERYRAALVRVAQSRLGRRDWAEDVTQETFLAAFKGRFTYDPSRNFRTWLWTILLHQCHRHWSLRARQPKVTCWSEEIANQEQAALARASQDRAEPEPLARLLRAERSALLEGLLRRLPSAQADALRLRFFADLKFSEIAETMACSLGTAKNRVKWGLLRLASWLAPDAGSSAARDRELD